MVTLDSLPDNYALIAVCVRVPYACHDAVRCVCKRLRAVAAREALARYRRASGWAEAALVVAGGATEGESYSEEEEEKEDDVNRPWVQHETWALVGGRWRAMAPMPLPRRESGVAVWGGEMVCAGGVVNTWNEEHRSWSQSLAGDLVAYDVANNVWRDLGAARVAGAPLRARELARCCVDPLTNAYVVVAGEGENGLEFREDMTLAAGEARAPWTALPPSPHEVLYFAMAVLGERLYVAGGLERTASGPGPKFKPPTALRLQVYNFRTRTWALGPPMPAARYQGDGAGFHGKFYVVGGKDEDDYPSSAVAVYNPVADAWASGPPLPRPRHNHAVLVHAGRLVVFGGEHEQTYLDPLVLDAAGTAWVSDPAVVPPLPDGFDFIAESPMVCSLPAG